MNEATSTLNQKRNQPPDDWWPCACVKGGNWRKGKPSTHIKLHSPSTKKCRVCGCTREESQSA